MEYTDRINAAGSWWKLDPPVRVADTDRLKRLLVRAVRDEPTWPIFGGTLDGVQTIPLGKSA